MNLTTATPAQIDTEINRIYGEINALNADTNAARDTIARVDAAAAGSYESYYWTPEKRTAAEDRIAANDAKFYTLNAEATPLEARYAAEQWTRYYLVDNSNGHVHTNKNCRTCYDTTQFVWLTEQSGMDRDGIVDLAGELSCAECFPGLPAEIMAKKTRIEDPAKRKTRQEREAKKAAAAAKKLEKALLPDGTELKVSTGHHMRYGFKEGGRMVEEFARFTTLASAKSWLTDAADYAGHNHPMFPADAAAIVASAVAAKEGKTAEVVLAEAAKRSAKRR